MKPPAVEIRIIKSAPGLGWEYAARLKGETVDASDGDAVYDHPGRALQAAIEGISAALAAPAAVPPAPTIGCLERDAMTMALRLLGEDEATFSPETAEVMSRWRPLALARLAQGAEGGEHG